MSDPLGKVHPGDRLRIQAETFNTMIDAAKDFLARQRNVGGGGPPAPLPPGMVWIRNDSGGHRARFDILGISDSVFSPSSQADQFQAWPLVAGVTPNGQTHAGRFAVLAEPIASGEIGRAWASGVLPVKVNIEKEEHRYADVNDGQAGSLKSAAVGAGVILWKESGTGQKWAIVRLGNPSSPQIRFGKPVSAFSSGATLTLDPCDAHGTDTGEENVTVYVQADRSSYAMHNSTTIPTSEIVSFVLAGDGYCYVLGRPVLVMTDFRYDTSTHYLQKKTRDSWGPFAGTESDWVNVGDSTECDDT